MDALFEFKKELNQHVADLCAFIVSNKLSAAQQTEVIDVFNAALKLKDENILTKENVIAKAGDIVALITKSHPNALDPLGDFLKPIIEHLKAEHPFVKHFGACSRVLLNPIADSIGSVHPLTEYHNTHLAGTEAIKSSLNSSPHTIIRNPIQESSRQVAAHSR